VDTHIEMCLQYFMVFTVSKLISNVRCIMISDIRILLRVKFKSQMFYSP